MAVGSDGGTPVREEFVETGELSEEQGALRVIIYRRKGKRYVPNWERAIILEKLFLNYFSKSILGEKSGKKLPKRSLANIA